MPQRSLIAGVTLLLVVVWGTTWAAIKIGLEGIPPFTGISIRFLLAGSILYVLARLWRVPSRRSRRLYSIWLIETLLGFCVSYGIVYWAEQWVPSGLASIIFSTMPLFVVVLAHFWLEDEPFRSTQLAGVALGMIGVTVIFAGDLRLTSGSQVLFPALVLLCSPLAAAIAHVLIKKWGSGFHPLNLVIVPMLATGVLMGAVALVFESSRPPDWSPRATGALLYLAVVGTALVFPLYYWLLERIAATRLALITLAIPVVAVLVGVMALGEPFSAGIAMGALLVLLGVWVAGRS